MSSVFDKLATKHKDPAIRLLAGSTLPLARKLGVPRELIQSLEKGLELSLLRLQFEEEITSRDSSVCSKIYKETMVHDWPRVFQDGKACWDYNPVMISGLVEGQFLKSFLSAVQAKDVLEVGMFTGYTAITMAEALPADGKVITIDRDEYLKDMVQSLIKDSPHKHKMEIVLGQAIELMKQMSNDGKSFDVIFLDADKSEYEVYLKLCLDGDLLRPNGTVIVDNAFNDSDGYTNPRSPTARFAQSIKNNPSLHVVLAPIKDGVYLIRRQREVDGSPK